MGACFHIAGVFCDNCRTGMSEERPRSLIFPMAPMSDEGDITGPYPQLLATAAEVASLRAEVERLKAERDDAWDRVDNLEGVIRDNIPYSYDQGEPDEDGANPEECVEYAAKEIADLKKENERLREAMRKVHALSAPEGDWLLRGWTNKKLEEIHKITKGMVE